MELKKLILMHILILYCISISTYRTKIEGEIPYNGRKIDCTNKIYYTKQAYRQISVRSINIHTEIMIFGFRYSRREIIIKLS